MTTQTDNDSQFPASFICPLTQEVMREPVIDHEGNSYEKAAIEEWLNKNATSPITRAPLDKTQLHPNRALKEAIDEKRKELGLPELPPSSLPVSPSQGVAIVAASSSSSSSSSSSVVSLAGVARAAENNIHDVLVSIKTGDGTGRTPVDVVCVIDVSGSMSTEATLKSAEGTVEAFGLSLLDIVKHAMKTIISALGPNDRLGLVTYSSSAKVEFELVEVKDEAKKAEMNAKVSALYPSGGTNIWDGLQQGLDMVKKVKSPGRLAAVLLLTDGQPTISPPRGEVQQLKRYKDQNGNDLSCSLNTFGFGYDINSELLNGLAVEGGGMYSFIPDSSFVGTTLVHMISNLLTTLAKNVTLSLEVNNGSEIVAGGLLGGHVCEKTSWGASYQLCSLQVGQSKDIVVRLSIPENIGEKPFLTATLKYELKDSEKPEEISLEINQKNGGLEVEVQKHRLVFVDTVREGVSSSPSKRTEVISATERLIESISASPSAKEPAVVALLSDLKGQVTEAFSRHDWFKKWGSHYLPSLVRAHLLQQCNNFKDPGVQVYGGTLFRTIRDQVDDLFLTLPPPTPSIAPRTSSYSTSTSTSSASSGGAPKSTGRVNMKSYHSSSRVCFAGSSLVTMADGTQKRVSEVRKGDTVKTSSSTSSEVICILKTTSRDSTVNLVELPGGLLVTPYHPVRLGNEGKWSFPCDLGKVEKRSCPAVFSFVLSSGHIMDINGYQCVSLGHGFEDDEVVKHPYFGTKKVIDDLKTMPGWNNGLIELLSGCVVKDEKTQLVCGLIHPSQITSGCGVKVLEEVKTYYLECLA